MEKQQDIIYPGDFDLLRTIIGRAHPTAPVSTWALKQSSIFPLRDTAVADLTLVLRLMKEVHDTVRGTQP